MSESENINDELLSAYLDDELAPEERARVEERLAVDPAARHLLEQLRAVSHAVKGLPQTPLGSDIRETVLRRAERAMLVSNPKGTGELASAGGVMRDDTSPRFTIGRSFRGWVWAGLATAAGLAIMAFESNSNREAKLPDSVAERSAESLDRAQPRPEPGAIAKSELQDVPSETSFSSPAMTAAPAAGVSVSGAIATDKSSVHGEQDRIIESSGNRAGGAVQPEVAGESRAGGENKDDGLAAGGSLAAAGKFSVAEPETTNSDSTDADLLVVHVRVKPEAYAERAFDQVLLRNGIAFEESSEEAKAAAANELAKDESSKPSSAAPVPTNAPATRGAQIAAGRQEQQLNDSSATAENTDLVLVEAPAAQIYSCLEELHKNDHDYLSVAVDEDQAVAKKANSDKGDEANWGQYNRGMELPRQKLQRGANNEFFYQTEQGSVAYSRSNNRDVEAPQPGQQRSLDEKATNIADQRGRATRMRSQASSEVAQQVGGGNARAQRLDTNVEPQSNANLTRGYASRDAKALPKEKAAPQSSDTLQVLFILSLGDQPAAPPPANAKVTK